MIEIKNLTKIYKSQSKEDVIAVNNISLSFYESGLIVINGESGCGKTTLLNILGGLDKKTSGEYIINKKRVEDFKSLDDFRNQVVGIVFQDYNLIENLNVFNNINLALSLQDNSNNKQMVFDVLAKVGLEGFEQRKINELSGGQKQRIAIARALVKNSQIILADEPTGNLDSETSNEIFKLLKEISKSKLVIVVSHDRKLSKQFADRLIELKDGKIVSDNGADEEVVDSEIVSCETSKPLKFKYIKSLTMHNILSHKLKTAIAIILLSLTTLTLCVGSALLFFDAQKAVSSSLSTSNVYLAQSIYDNKKDDFNPMVFDSYTNINQAVYSQTLQDNKKIKGYNITLDFNNSKYYEDCFYLIQSRQDLLDLGYEFYGANEISNNGVYVTDYVIDYLLSNDCVLSDTVATNDYQEMIGKFIKKYNEFERGYENKYKIDGIIKTDYKKYYDENFEIKAENQGDFASSDIYEQFVCQQKNVFYLPIYINQSYLKNNYKEVNSLDLQASSQYSLNVKTSKDNILKSIILSSNLYNYDTIYNNKVVSASSITLGENEILINLKLYNQLFNNEIKFLQLLQHISNQEGESVCDYNFQHLNNIISVKYIQTTLNQSLIEFNNKKIVGVVIKDYSSQETDGFEIYTKDSDIKNNFLLNYCNNLIMMQLNGNATEIISNLRSNYNIGVFDIVAKDIYSLEQSAKLISFIFLSISIILSLISVFVAINVVTLSINERKKEIGILRAIGTKSRDVEKIFLLENTFVGLASFVISQAFISISIFLMNTIFSKNSVIGTKYLFYDFKILLISLVTTFILCVIVCLIPIKKLNKLNPIDCIRNAG